KRELENSEIKQKFIRTLLVGLMLQKPVDGEPLNENINISAFLAWLDFIPPGDKLLRNRKTWRSAFGKIRSWLDNRDVDPLKKHFSKKIRNTHHRNKIYLLNLYLFARGQSRNMDIDGHWVFRRIIEGLRQMDKWIKGKRKLKPDELLEQFWHKMFYRLLLVLVAPGDALPKSVDNDGKLAVIMAMNYTKKN